MGIKGGSLLLIRSVTYWVCFLLRTFSCAPPGLDTFLHLNPGPRPGSMMIPPLRGCTYPGTGITCRRKKLRWNFLRMLPFSGIGDIYPCVWITGTGMGWEQTFTVSFPPVQIFTGNTGYDPSSVSIRISPFSSSGFSCGAAFFFPVYPCP